MLTTAVSAPPAAQRIRTLVAAQPDAAPRYLPARVRQSVPLFVGEARHNLTRLQTQAEWRARLPAAVVDHLLTQVQRAVEAAEQLSDAFLTVDTQLATAPHMGRVHSAAVLGDTAAAADVAAQVRTVVALMLTGDTPLDEDLRHGCGVGDPTRYSAPADVLRLVSRQVATLSQPEHAAHLAQFGVPAGVWLVQLESWQQRLTDGMEGAHRQKRQELRNSRDQAQRCVEQVWLEVASLFLMALGREVFNGLRALMPTTRRAARKATAKDGESSGEGESTQEGGEETPPSEEAGEGAKGPEGPQQKAANGNRMKDASKGASGSGSRGEDEQVN